MSSHYPCSKCGYHGNSDVLTMAKCPLCGASFDSTLGEDLTPPTVQCASPRPPADPQPPNIPGFYVETKIGQGGMGLVYRARQLNLNRDVALKFLPPKLAADKDSLERFRREAAVAAALTKAQILPVYDILEVEAVPVLVLPYIAGGNLNEVIKDHWATFDAAAGKSNRQINRDYVKRMLPLLDQMIQAVAVLHSADVVHRDIKPSNLLLDGQGHVWLADFGLAQLKKDIGGNSTPEVVGTPGYMSPEQAAGQLDVDTRADLFSVGVTLYRALTGEMPYGIRRIDVDESLPAAPSTLQPALPKDFDAVIIKSLHPNRDLRYSNAKELRDDWQRVRQGLLPHARNASPFRRLAHWMKRYRWQTAVTGFALLLGIVGAMLMIGRPAVAVDENLRKIRITTVPAGAQVVLVPIDEYGAFQETAIVRPSQPTPLVVDGLAPGRYLVVANLPGHGFHEVYRVAPHKTLGNGLHLYDSWTKNADGSLDWPAIKIPPQIPVVNEMAYMPGGGFIMGLDGRDGFSFKGKMSSPAHETAVAPFYLDPTEITVCVCEKTRRIPPEMEKHFGTDVADFQDYPVAFISFPKALEMAERLGKRLPTEAEYEYAATNGGQTHYPWGNDATLVKDILWASEKPGPVGNTVFDVNNFGVRGLYSNVLEWTDSFGASYAKSLHPSVLRSRNGGEDYFKTFASSRILRGGPAWLINGTRATSEAQANALGPRNRFLAEITQSNMSIGFRCARSAAPRFFSPEAK